MFRKVFPGVIINDVGVNVEEELIYKFLNECLPGRKWENENLDIQQYVSKDGIGIIRIFGMDIPWGHIKYAFFGKKIGQSPVIMFQPDFGCPRDSSGAILQHFEIVNRNMERGHGFFPVINVFDKNFLEKFGHISRISSKIIYDVPIEEVLNTGVLSVCGRPISVSRISEQSTRCKLLDNMTLIEYQTRLEALQAVCYFNKRRKLSVKAGAFLTGQNYEPCEISNSFGLGSENSLLNIKHYDETFGYVPFEVFGDGIINPKLNEYMTFQCSRCTEMTRPIGISADLTWINYTCYCIQDTSGMLYRWHGEGFFRMTLANFQNTNIYKFYQSSQWRITDPIIHYIRALLPQYKNPNEYEEIAVRAFEVELVHMERISICNQVLGVITKIELVEYCKVDGVLSAITVVEIKVPYSLFWCQAGLAKFGTILLRLHREKGLFVDHWDNFSHHNKEEEYTECQLYTVALEETSMETVIRVLAPCNPDALFKHGNQVKVVAKPSRSELDEINKTTKEWRTNLLRRQHGTKQHQGYVEAAVWLGSTLWENTLDMFDVYRLRICTPNNGTWKSVADKLPTCFGAVDISLHVKTASKGKKIKTEGRITGLGIRPFLNYNLMAKSCYVDVVVVLPHNFDVIVQTPCTLAPWLIVASLDDIPFETLEMMRFPFFPPTLDTSNDSGADSGEEELHNDDLRRKTDELSDDGYNDKEQQNEDGISGVRLQVYFDRSLARIDLSSLKSILDDWRTRPELNMDLLDFFLQKRSFIKHENTLSMTLPENPVVDEMKLKHLEQILNPSQREACRNMLKTRVSISFGENRTVKSTSAALGVLQLYLTDPGFIVAACATDEAAKDLNEKMLLYKKTLDLDINIIIMETERQEREWLNSDRSSLNSGNLLHAVIRNDQLCKSNPKLKALLEREKSIGPMYLTSKERQELSDWLGRVALSILRNTDVLICTIEGACPKVLVQSLKQEIGNYRKMSGLVIYEASQVILPRAMPLLGMGFPRVWLIGGYGDRTKIYSKSAQLACLGNSIITWFSMTRLFENGNNISHLE